MHVLVISAMTSCLLVGAPLLDSCHKLPTTPNSAIPDLGEIGKFNCQDGYYNPLAALLFSENEDTIKFLFSQKTVVCSIILF